MGNYQFKCPSETTSGPAPLSCVMTCPEGFELTAVGGPRCVHKDDPDVSIHLIAQPAVPRAMNDNSIFSIMDLKTTHPDAYVRYTKEFDRFVKEKAIAISNVDHAKEVEAASAAVLAAAGKEQSVVDAAAARYLEVTGDPDAAAYTINRGIKTELDKNTGRFIDEYRFLSNQSKQQQDTMDLISSVKDNLFMVKDDLEFSVGTFDKQVSDIQNQINKNKRIHEQAVDYGAWMLMGLNIAVVLALIFAVFILGRGLLKFGKGVASSSTSSTRQPSEDTASFFSKLDDYFQSKAASAAPAKRGWLW